jgi:Fur family iron response transcriptional regulator
MDSPRPYTRVITLLKRVGLRPTRQRLTLARLLFDGDDRHVTAEQLYDEAVAANVPVSLATVYNALHQFTETGLLREVVVEAGRSYFDTNTTDHCHFFYEDTGELRDIPEHAISVVSLPELPEGTGLNRVDVVVRITGTGGQDGASD